jgi:hypothetical protein
MEEFAMIMKYAQGNPGAMMFLIELLKPENMMFTIPIAIKLEEIPSLKGTNLYVLYSDLCNKDMSKVMQLCKSCPNNILEDACSRQDYSGRELVAQYLQ